MKRIHQEFWVGKKVLITGHTGFKGAWLSLWLQFLGAELQGLALDPPTSPSLFDEARVAEGMVSWTGDITDLDTVKNCMEAFRPEMIVHLAAQALVRRSYLEPVETFSTNVMGTLNILEAARSLDSVRCILNVTSDKCYENREWSWGYRENEPMGGHDPYSSSKGCSELLSSAYRRSFFQSKGVALATARAGNVIGGGDWAEDRLVPDILRALQSGCSPVIRNPGSVRPWQHVLEPLSGYLMLLKALWENGPKYSEAWNFGPEDDDAQPVGDVLRKMSQFWGTDAVWQHDGENQPHEAVFLKLDISKAKQKLGWRPRWNLDKALENTVAWHKAWLDRRDMRAYCLNEISAYLKNR